MKKLVFLHRLAHNPPFQRRKRKEIIPGAVPKYHRQCPECHERFVKRDAPRCFRCETKDEQLFHVLDLLIRAKIDKPRAQIAAKEIERLVNAA